MIKKLKWDQKPRSFTTQGVAQERPDKSQKDANFADVKGGLLSSALLHNHHA